MGQLAHVGEKARELEIPSLPVCWSEFILPSDDGFISNLSEARYSRELDESQSTKRAEVSGDEVPPEKAMPVMPLPLFDDDVSNNTVYSFYESMPTAASEGDVEGGFCMTFTGFFKKCCSCRSDPDPFPIPDEVSEISIP